MRKVLEQQLPVARKEGLLIEKLPDEVLVYDLDRKKAHCLNQTAALIWSHCDGKTRIHDIAQILQKQSDRKVHDELVWFGLGQLQKARLLTEPSAIPVARNGLSRRELVKRIGLAVSIPLVVSIIAPQASAALSCAVPCITVATCQPPCNNACTSGVCA